MIVNVWLPQEFTHEERIDLLRDLKENRIEFKFIDNNYIK